MSREIKKHDIYDDLIVNEVTTVDKVKNEFKKQKQLVTSGRPKAFVLKHDISKFDVSKFKQHQKICPTCRANGITSYIMNPRLESETTWVGLCDKCGTAASFFNPTPVQQLIVDLNAPIINNIAGFGSGKTEFDMWYVARRALTVDGSDIMIAGGSKDGLVQAKGFLQGHFGRPWKHTKDKDGDFIKMNEQMWVTKNGSKIRFLNVDTGKIEKFRSWQLDLAVLIEASADAFYKNIEGEGTFWDELQKRMRNSIANVNAKDEKGEPFQYITEAGTTKAYQHGSIAQIILESNPKNSDIIPMVFNKSAILITTEKVANKEKTIERFMKNYDAQVNGESGIVSILASTNDNPMLSEKYIKQSFPPGTSPAFIARMRDADLSKNEGQVYQHADKCFAPRRPVTTYTSADKIYSVMDPGTVDPTALIYASLWYDFNSTGKPKVVVWHASKTKGGTSREGNSLKEICDGMDEVEVSYGLSSYNPKLNKIDRSYIHPITKKRTEIIRIADQAMWKSEKTGDEMVQAHTNEAEKYRKKGFRFKQSLKGPKSIEYGISLADTYMENGTLEFADDLFDLEEEFIKYEYTADNKGNLVPKAKDDHLMDALRYLAFEIDNELQDYDMESPKLLSGDERKIRDAMAKRGEARDERARVADELLGFGDDFLSRTETFEKIRNNKNKEWK